MAKLRLNQEKRTKLKIWFANRVSFPAEEKKLEERLPKIKQRITDELNRWLDKQVFDKAQLERPARSGSTMSRPARDTLFSW